MSSPTVLITGGCSYSQIQKQDKSWPLHLQELSSIRYVSHTGHGAGGNQIISRKIISTVMKAIELGHKPEDILVGVMWSACDRQSHYSTRFDQNYTRTSILGPQHKEDFIDLLDVPCNLFVDLHNKSDEDPNQWQHGTNPFSIRDQKNPKHYIMNTHWNDELTSIYFEHFVNPEKAIIETCENILRTQWFLKDKGINYFFTEYDYDVFHYTGPFGYGLEPSEHPGHDFTPNGNNYGGIYSVNSECIQWPNDYTQEMHNQHLTNPEIDYLYNAIDKDYFLPIDNLGKWAKEKSIYNFARKGDPHPSTEQHRDFVDKVILPFLLEKYNISSYNV